MINPHISVAFLAVYMRRAGHDVAVVDAVTERLDTAYIADYIKKSRPDMVGLSAMADRIHDAAVTCRNGDRGEDYRRQKCNLNKSRNRLRTGRRRLQSCR